MTDNKKPESAKESAVKVETSGSMNNSSPVIEKAGNDQTKLILIVVGAVIAFCCLCSAGSFVVSTVLNKAGDKVADEANKGLEDKIKDAIEGGLENDDDKNTDTDVDFDGGAKLPEGWPSEIKLYKDSKVITASRTKSGDGYNYSIIGNIQNVKKDDVVSYFKDMMENLGWELETETDIFGTTLSYKKGNDQFTVNLTAYSADSSQVNYVISLNDK